MKTKIIEATNGPRNWGKFMVARFDNEEWTTQSQISGNMLIRERGWTREHTWVLDLQTGEGALFRLGGLASADLDSHRIWVCPLFEPFLVWLYTQARLNDPGPRTLDLDALPLHVNLADAPFDISGYRRDATMPCPSCKGFGKICVDDYLDINHVCSRCNGTKRVPAFCTTCSHPL